MNPFLLAVIAILCVAPLAEYLWKSYRARRRSLGRLKRTTNPFSNIETPHKLP